MSFKDNSENGTSPNAILQERLRAFGAQPERAGIFGWDLLAGSSPEIIIVGVHSPDQ